MQSTQNRYQKVQKPQEAPPAQNNPLPAQALAAKQFNPGPADAKPAMVIPKLNLPGGNSGAKSHRVYNAPSQVQGMPTAKGQPKK